LRGIGGTTARENFDDEYASAATRTRTQGRRVGRRDVFGGRGVRLRSWHVEQLTGSRDVLPALRAGEQAIVADAVEARRQHVDEEAADELLRGERRHRPPH
jgi:hypothetical protein